ncbi:enoyl-CoA hydratase/isomerase family protein (plasmid) [Bradyrhizobium sp. 62B]|uniref:enoyl-CoA hydratase/isomerase family protein n=1 Tax=Bradyrhizobium sp. 62B TaxID=2898442 RepID=UPI0025582503|nr:enoyl-CoA hydratase/isomerase family protein [Bradyrhizobium sp. 62B]
MAALSVYERENVLVAQFTRDKPVNPLNRELARGIVEACQTAQEASSVKALVLTGGLGRSFCAGDDLNEVSQIASLRDVEDLIENVLELCVAILGLTKPTVAGIDGYVIGAGVQMALCCDWRVGTSNTKAFGWELKHGLACPMNAYMLEKSLGRAAMSEIIFGCEMLPIGWAEEHKVFNEIADAKDVVDKAISRAAVLGSCSEVSYRRTKEVLNRPFIAGLKAVAPLAKDVHAEGFRNNSASSHFARVLRQ